MRRSQSRPRRDCTIRIENVSVYAGSARAPAVSAAADIELVAREDDRFEHFHVRRQGGHQECDFGDFVNRNDRLVVFWFAASCPALGRDVTGLQAAAGHARFAGFQGGDLRQTPQAVLRRRDGCK